MALVGIAAVLIATVTYTGYLTPPGANQYYAACPYRIFTAFIILNGFTFMFAVFSLVLVIIGAVYFNDNDLRRGHLLWSFWFLVLSALIFMASFILVGLINSGLQAPSPQCSAIKCSEGGVRCYNSWDPRTNSLKLDPRVSQLNNIQKYGSDTLLNCSVWNELVYSDMNASNCGLYCSVFDIPAPQCVPVSVLPCTNCSSLKSLQQNKNYTFCQVTNSSWQGYGTYSFCSLSDVLTAANRSDIMECNPNCSVAQSNGLINPLSAFSLAYSMVPYSKLNYQCISYGSRKAFDVLCDTRTNLSVDNQGGYLQSKSDLVKAGGDLFPLVFPTPTSQPVKWSSIVYGIVSGTFILVYLAKFPFRNSIFMWLLRRAGILKLAKSIATLLTNCATPVVHCLCFGFGDEV